MAKPTIVTRAGKGSALTWTEGDSNLTNLQNATLTVKAGTGGTDVVSDLNGTVTLVAGTNVTLSGDNTAKTVTINSTASGGATTLDGLTDVVITAAATNDVLVYNGTNWVDTAASTLIVSAASTATTATGATNVNISTTTGNSNDTTLYPVMVAAASTGNQLPHIDSTGMSFDATNNVLTLGSSGASNAGEVKLFSDSTGSVALTAPTTTTTYTLTFPTTAGSASQVLTTNGSGTLSWTTPFAATGTLTGAVNITNLAILNSTSTSNPKLTIGTGALSSGAWTTSGIGMRVSAATYTDTTSVAGTVAASHVHGIAASTIASTNIITVTDAASLYVAAAPTAGTNTTITNGWAILAGGRIKASAIDATPVGSTTASTGAFTTLSASGAVTLSPASAAVAISPSGTGTVAISPAGALTINPTTAGTINNMSIGATTPAAGTFTTATLDAGGELRLNNTADTFYVGFKAGTLAANTIWTLPTADGTANQVLKTDGAGNLGWSTAGGGSFDPASPGEIGGTTPALGTFTGLIAKGNGTTASPARLSLPVVDHWSTAWTTNGIGISAPGGFTYRDTTSTGTVSAVYVHTLGGATLARTNTGAFTNAATLYVAQPSAGFQTTITNPALAAFFDGPVRVAQNLNVDGGFSFNGSIGGTSPNTGAFTTLTTTDTVSMTGTSKTVTIAPTGASSSVVINCGSGGTINNMTVGVTTAAAGNFTSIGATTPGTGTFTSITANGTGSVILSPSSGTVTINPNGASTINNTSIGVTTAAAGRFTTLTATGAITLVDVRETVFAIGNSGTSTLTPNAANGSVQTITATGNFTLSAFTSPVSGQTITFIITQDATGSRTLTSTMKFAGGSKTLTTTANAIDILTVSYIGTTYYASLSKGFV